MKDTTKARLIQIKNNRLGMTFRIVGAADNRELEREINNIKEALRKIIDALAME